MSRRISFIVLFYRDAPTVRPVIAALDSVLSRGWVEYEIIAIDDHSPDSTGATIDRVAAEFSKVVPLHNATNLGVGGSFRRAVEHARHEWIGYTDGDDQYEMEDLKTFWPLLEAHDVVSGFRSQRADGWHRRIISQHFNWITNRLFGMRLRDTNSALKIYRAQMLQSLAGWDTRAFYDSEILIKLTRDQAADIAETPIHHRDRSHGRAAGLSTANLNSVINGMTGPEMAAYREKSLFATFLIVYCRSLLAALRLTQHRRK